MITQLTPSIPVHVLNKGSGEAIFLLDYSKEDHIIWGVALDSDGSVWWVPNPDIRLLPNYSIGRTKNENKID